MYEKSVFVEYANGTDRQRFVNYVTRNHQMIEADIALRRFKSSHLNPTSYKGVMIELFKKRYFVWGMSLKWLLSFGYNMDDVEECFDKLAGYLHERDIMWLVTVKGLDRSVLERNFHRFTKPNVFKRVIDYVDVKKCKFRKMTDAEKYLVMSQSKSLMFILKVRFLY